jgi:poly(A) polymerase
MGLNELENSLIRKRILPSLGGLLQAGSDCFLVGGAIRDALLNRCSDDFDFATAADPTELAQAFAAELGGSWFMLDTQRRQSRVVAGQGIDRLCCDFSPFRAYNLEGDLQRRDFTINAMAMAVQPDATLGPVYDPLGGQRDLQHGRLRCCSSQVLFDDPLRVLKGLRHAICLQLTIEPSTLSSMRHAASSLNRVAPERIRNELAAMLAVSPARRSLLWLQELNLLELLFGNAAKPGVSGVGFARLDRAEAWLEFLVQAEESGSLAEFFAWELEQGISRAVAFKLAAWFSGQKFGDVRFILQKLHCSRAVQQAIDCLLDLEQRQAEELLQLPPVARSRALWAEDLGSHPKLAVCYLGLLLNVPFAEAARLLHPVLDDLNCYRGKGKVPALLTGSWLQKTLQLRGPAIGRCLAALRQEEIAGRVVNRQQAEQFVLNHWRKAAEKTIDKET